ELNEDERARLLADSREKLRRDISSIKRSAEKEARAVGWEKGLAEGRIEGQKEGRAEGRVEASRAIARNLLKLGRPIDEIMSVTSLSKEEIQSLSH
ncbi:MAG: transposase, partial [Betaproteobacteria bacterium]|nr:transposase [Betaproteobacteria bacterium]